MSIRCRAGLLILCGAAALLFGVAARADVYLSVSADGHPTYANVPRTSADRLLYVDPAKVWSTGLTVPTGREPAEFVRRRERMEPLIMAAAATHGLDPALLRAIIHVESRFNPLALSTAGASGVMQLMPATARRYGVVNRADPRQNIDAGARYLRDLLGQFGGNVALALSAYNAGEGAVLRHARRVPPYRETLTYVPEVMARAVAYRSAAELPSE